MKLKKIIINIFFSMCMVLLVGCVNGASWKYNNDKLIASKADSWGVNDDEQTAKETSYEGKLELSGYGTIWELDSDMDFDLEMQYKFSVDAGKGKLVFIDPDNTVTTLVEKSNDCNQKELETLVLPIKKGKNRIKLVGCKDAKIDANIEINQGTFEKISFE